MMALNVTYKYKQQKPDFEQRKLEGSRTLKNYPSKIPVSLGLHTHQLTCLQQVAIGRVSKSGLPELENFKLLLPASSSGMKNTATITCN